MEQCVALVLARRLSSFRAYCDGKDELAPFVRLDALCVKAFSLLTENRVVSRTALFSDTSMNDDADIFQSFSTAFGPLVAACRPDWSQSKAERRTFALTAALIQAFLRPDVVLRGQGIDLSQSAERSTFFTQLLRDILDFGR